jgi:hypothetical protein
MDVQGKLSSVAEIITKTCLIFRGEQAKIIILKFDRSLLRK